MRKLLLILAIALTGCQPPQQPIQYIPTPVEQCSIDHAAGLTNFTQSQTCHINLERPIVEVNYPLILKDYEKSVKQRLDVAKKADKKKITAVVANNKIFQINSEFLKLVQIYPQIQAEYEIRQYCARKCRHSVTIN